MVRRTAKNSPKKRMKKPSNGWKYAIIGLLVFVGIVVAGYFLWLR